MWWTLFFALYGEYIFAILAALSLGLRTDSESQIEPDPTFYKEFQFMFPENFLAKYPHEANPYRLKIYAYLIFNLLAKGYGSVDPGRFWETYNRDDYSRALIDAVFYEYLTNFTDGEAKDISFDPLDSSKDHTPVSKDLHLWKGAVYSPNSNEDIAIDRIGQYLDLLADTEPQQKRSKVASEIQSEDDTIDDCEMPKIETSGVPGIDYPNFCDIPETSFSCTHSKKPGIYADFETGCQAFHICWPHRIDSFLCPIGTIFNQRLLTCDIWHNARCYASSFFGASDQFRIEVYASKMNIPPFDGSCESPLTKMLRLNLKYLPAKCEVKYLQERKVATTKAPEPDASDLAEKIDTAYVLVQEMLQMVREIREDLNEEITNRRDPWIYALEKRTESKSIPKLRAETEDEAVEVTKKIGHLKSSKVAGRVRNAGKFSPKVKPVFYVKPSILLKPSKSLKVPIKSSRKQAIPKIVMKSPKLGGSILNKGIPLTKQVLIDSYRKIKSKKQ